jgi:DNA-binding transcriptional regulator YhcF (GntR family)
MSRLLTVINRYADRPIYRQLSDLLEARLAEAAKPGDRLPSEAELSHEYDVNRLTVRRALSELNQRGLIETVHGKGSFVAPPRVRYNISAGRDASLTRTMQELGHRVSIRLLVEVPITEVEVVLDADVDGKPGLAVGWGASMGTVERRGISLALLDAAMQADGELREQLVLDEQTVIAATDGSATNGFVEHLRLPHYAGFAAYLAQAAVKQAR